MSLRAVHIDQIRSSASPALLDRPTDHVRTYQSFTQPITPNQLMSLAVFIYIYIYIVDMSLFLWRMIPCVLSGSRQRLEGATRWPGSRVALAQHTVQYTYSTLPPS